MVPRDPPPAANVRAELERILASDFFTRSDRLSAYLKFIVERTLAGEGHTLKEQVIATELYGKATDFSTAADPIVRVDARRLRDHLREYDDSAPPGTLVISVPKGSYTPEFTAATTAATAVAPVAAPAATPRRGSERSWIAAAAAATIIAAAWVVMDRFIRQGAEPTRLLTVTSLPGAEEDPSMSPDSNFVAFSWNAIGSLNGDIWVKAVDGEAMRRLTDTPDANEKFPAWSHDGQYIAFTRQASGTSSVVMVSALGGPEQVIAPRSSYASWFPDDKSLVVLSRSPEGRFSLVRHVLETGAPQQLTEAPVGFVEAHPRVSPDGRTVAFLRYGAGRSAVFLQNVVDGGEPVQLVDWTSGMAGGLTWTPDGRDLIYGRPELSGRRLVRVTVGRQQAPTPVPGTPQEAVGPSMSKRRNGGGDRLAFVSGQPDVGLRLVDLQASHQNGVIDATPFCDATRMDVPGRFSADSSRVAFVSDRSGNQQVWVAERDQSGLRSVTNLQAATVNVGSWAPDGRSIAFDATIAANTDIYIAPVDGGPLTRLTTGPAIEMDAEWSRDGRWIYYASDETGRSEIWKMSADGRTRTRLTSEGGFDPRESADGQFVYFVAAQRWYGLGPGTSLEQVPANGGTATLVLRASLPERGASRATVWCSSSRAKDRALVVTQTSWPLTKSPNGECTSSGRCRSVSARSVRTDFSPSLLTDDGRLRSTLTAGIATSWYWTTSAEPRFPLSKHRKDLPQLRCARHRRVLLTL